MKKERDCMNMYAGYNTMMMPNMVPYTPQMNMGMPNMIPMPNINTYDNGLNSLNNRVTMLEKRVAKLEGSNSTTPYDSNYYMV